MKTPNQKNNAGPKWFLLFWFLGMAFFMGLILYALTGGEFNFNFFQKKEKPLVEIPKRTVLTSEQFARRAINSGKNSISLKENEFLKGNSTRTATVSDFPDYLFKLPAYNLSRKYRFPLLYVRTWPSGSHLIVRHIYEIPEYYTKDTIFFGKVDSKGNKFPHIPTKMVEIPPDTIIFDQKNVEMPKW